MLSNEHQETLAALLDSLVPADETWKMPGAGDPEILADILETAAPHGPALTAIPIALEAMARDSGDTTFVALASVRQAEIAQAFMSAQPDLAALLTSLIARCYYRDDRVMRSLGMEARPPHPGGFEVEQGDWSLLDPVKARAPFFRKVP